MKDGIKMCVVKPGEQMDITHFKTSIVARPTEFHIKPDGALDDMPSLLIVMEHPDIDDECIYGEISLRMLMPVLMKLLDVGEEQLRAKGITQGTDHWVRALKEGDKLVCLEHAETATVKVPFTNTCLVMHVKWRDGSYGHYTAKEIAKLFMRAPENDLAKQNVAGEAG